MQYATVSQFIERMGRYDAIMLTDREQTGEVNESVLNVALNDASSQIDSYLNGRYTLPLPRVPLHLVRICCDLARYLLASMSQTGITQEIINRYKLLLKELEQIGAGQISLGLDDGNPPDQPDDAVMFFNGNNRIFVRDNKN